MSLPTDPKARKDIPIASGVLDYFPDALAEIARVSKAGNDQHNPGEPLHWARGKSMDQADTIIRHFLERGTIDSDGLRHSAKMAWRALALLQLEMEAAGAPLARGARETAIPHETQSTYGPRPLSPISLGDAALRYANSRIIYDAMMDEQFPGIFQTTPFKE